jgi:hypothetical protein
MEEAMSIFGRLIPWWVPIAVIGFLCVVILGQRVQVSNAKANVARAKAEFSDWKLAAAENRILADRAQRVEEQRREDNTRKAIDEAKKRTEVARADAVRVAGMHGRVREQFDAYRAAVRRASADPAVAAGSSPAIEALDLFAHLLSGSGKDAGELAKFADAAHGAGLTCERIADGLQPASK